MSRKMFLGRKVDCKIGRRITPASSSPLPHNIPCLHKFSLFCFAKENVANETLEEYLRSIPEIRRKFENSFIFICTSE